MIYRYIKDMWIILNDIKKEHNQNLKINIYNLKTFSQKVAGILEEQWVLIQTKWNIWCLGLRQFSEGSERSSGGSVVYI